MKRTDIRAGVVYAYQRSRSYGTPEPIVFLAAPADGVLFKSGRTVRASGRAFQRAPEGETKPRTYGSTWDQLVIGYPVVMFARGGAADETPLADLLSLTLDDFAAVDSAHDTSVKGAYFTVLTTLGQVTGLYEEKVAEYEAQREAERAKRERDQVERDAAVVRADAVTDRLNVFGVDAQSFSDGGRHYGYVRLSVADAEKLAAALEA
jgi:hypothetical protein